MDTVIGIIALVLGFALGAAACTVYFREKLKNATDAVKAQLEPEKATLAERLRQTEEQLTNEKKESAVHAAELAQLRANLGEEGKIRAAAEEKNSRIPDLEQGLRKLQGELAGLAAELKSTAEQRSAAEEKCGRIPALEAVIIAREETIAGLQKERTELYSKISEIGTALQKEQKAAADKLALLEETKQKLSDAFQALSSDALRKNNATFLELAQTALKDFQNQAKGELEKRQQAIGELVKPVRDSLEKFDQKISTLEKDREGAYKGLTEQVQMLLQTQHQLRAETGNLVRALRAPVVRGRWGEIQLKRVVEMAGMVEHCHFVQQESVNTEDGRLRPDLVVKLPAGKNILIDAKCPLEGYLSAIEASDETTRKARMADHARQIDVHIKALGRKAYWEQFEPSPEFVVLFLPNESFFSAALEENPRLIEIGSEEKVILATPTTLIALLRAVHYGWKQERLAENAKEISDYAKELYARLATMGEHWGKVGRNLGNAVEAYNKATSSLESRVLPSARKLKELHAGTDEELETLLPLETLPRPLQAPELTGGNEASGK